MCEPFKIEGRYPTAQDVMCELSSAQSALNMYPSPIEGVEGYLSETDEWVKHAYEHIEHAHGLLRRMVEEEEIRKVAVYRERVRKAEGKVK